jgi:hypothetical protein
MSVGVLSGGPLLALFSALSLSIRSLPYSRYSLTKAIGAPVLAGSACIELFYIKASGGGIIILISLSIGMVEPLGTSTF